MKFNQKNHEELWQHLARVMEAYVSEVAKIKITPDSNPEEIRSWLAPLTFEQALSPIEAVDFVVAGLRQHQVQVSHPRYFGLFNPPTTSMGVAGDTLAAVFNPQLATWNHSPFAIEVEQHLIRSFGVQFGYSQGQAEGTFTSGGAEANHTALLAALVHKFPKFARLGLRGLDRQPCLYVSSQSHHSLLKAARLCGLGERSVRQIPVDKELKMNVKALIQQIDHDKAQDFDPFLIVATAGTTNAGVIDPIQAIKETAEQNKIWCHVDAAWGGAAMLVEEYRSLFNGIEAADSITFDTHKWLFIPMGAGMFLTRRIGILNQAFQTTAAYMPPDASKIKAVDPYMQSMQWSRRFIGLKVFLSLAVAGWKGYRNEISRQIKLGDLLRQELYASNWKVVNSTDLPLVCFRDGLRPKKKPEALLNFLIKKIVTPGKAWISKTYLAKDFPVLRACVNNYLTEESDILALVEMLNDFRCQFYRNA